MKNAALALVMMLWPGAAQAGAWTQEQDRAQVIGSVIASTADQSFDAGGSANIALRFRRLLLQTYLEYGWTPDVTLIAGTETASVDVSQAGVAPLHAIDNAVSLGVRARLDRWLGWDVDGVLSLEASVRAAGAFNFAVSANGSTGGSGGQLRLLYGRSFKLDGRDGFLDIEAGHEFLSGMRPDETPLDLTWGWWLDPADMVMAQSFNLFGGQGAIAAYPAFESHKLQLSWVRQLSPRFLVQAGGFFSPAGRNALVEQGLCLALWSRF